MHLGSCSLWMLDSIRRTALMRSKQLLSPVIADLHPWPWPAVWQYVLLVTRGSMGGSVCVYVCVCVCVCVCARTCVCLYLCTSITINGKSPLSSHPVEGQISHAAFKTRGQQAAVLGTSKVSFIWCWTGHREQSKAVVRKARTYSQSLMAHFAEHMYSWMCALLQYK